MSEHPSSEDYPYLHQNFVSLDVLCRAHRHDPSAVRAAIADRLLPQPAYMLEDGTELVAPDYFDLANAAGSFERLPAWFAEAWDHAAENYPDVPSAAEAWDEYLTGLFGVCLRSVTPAAIVAKVELMNTISRLIDDPSPEDHEWRVELAAAVDALDALERPFAAFDRQRFGPVSRDRLVTAVRERYELEPRVLV